MHLDCEPIDRLHILSVEVHANGGDSSDIGRVILSVFEYHLRFPYARVPQEDEAEDKIVRHLSLA